jgi:hypothetical protein
LDFVPFEVLMVIVDPPLVLPDTLTDEGLNVAEPPFGRPVAVKVTEPLKPVGVMVIAVDFEEPRVIVKLPGLAPNWKLPVGGGAALTTKVTVVMCVSAPLVPVIVKV